MQTTLHTTPLNSAHRALGAKMVGFAGWDMPLHYGSQIEEHHHVRRDAGMFDVSHMLAVDVLGGRARSFLLGLLANDVGKLKEPGAALYSCMLNEQGGVLDDLIVYFLGETHFRLVVNAGTADKDCAWLAARRDRHEPTVTIEPRRDLGIIAVQGPQAREKTWRALPQLRAATERLAPFRAAQAGGMLVARTGYTGEDGFEIMVPAAAAAGAWEALAASDVAPAGIGARDTLRLEAGMNLYGQDMDETVTPLESGLAWTVAIDAQREFCGKSALQRQPLRQLLGVLLLDKGVMRGHQGVRGAAGSGEITSGGYSPTLNRSIALARVPAPVAPGDDIEVAVRDKWLRARAVKPPFVRRGKILISVEC